VAPDPGTVTIRMFENKGRQNRRIGITLPG
jgi:hypothetical protein